MVRVRSEVMVNTLGLALVEAGALVVTAATLVDEGEVVVLADWA